MGSSDGQKNIFHTVQLEDLVPDDHPLRRIRPLIDTARIRELCADFYCADNGRPSIPPEQIFLAMLGGYLLGCRSDRNIIRQLTCDMALRWFVGLDIDSPVWDPSTFSKNREHRFDDSGIFEKLFDQRERAFAKHHGFFNRIELFGVEFFMHIFFKCRTIFKAHKKTVWRLIFKSREFVF